MIFGEVHSGLLQNSVALGQQRTSQLLDLLQGERVRRAERPIAYAVSPDLLAGVDCNLPSRSGRAARCVGTVVTHAAITGGHVLQGSSYARIGRIASQPRLPWSHYLARPGQVDVSGKAEAGDLADGFAAALDQPGLLNLGAISGRTVDTVQRSSALDRRPPFRSRRTRMRWTVLPTADPSTPPRGTFRVESETLRLLHLTVGRDHLPGVVQLCEDLALHDWLLTTLLSLMESSFTDPGDLTQRMDRLRPAIDYLLHLWMPAARVDESVLPVWQSLERRPGFTRQWEAAVSRIRDQMSLATIALLQGQGPGQARGAACRGQSVRKV
jgi:hypothetical protein